MANSLRLSSTKEDEKWRAEDDLRILARAEEVRRDPRRMKAAREMAKEKMTEMGAIAGSKPE